MNLRAVVLLALCATARAGTLEVPGQYATIQAALDAAHSGDEIVVQPGTYHEALVLPAIKLSLLAPGGAGATFVLATGLDASVLRALPKTGPTASVARLVQGFTLAGGSGTGLTTGVRYGGGVYAPSSAGLVLSGCRIVANTALGSAYGRGGGVYGALQLEDCEISDNQALQGGGVAAEDPAQGPVPALTLTGCTVNRNVAELEGGGTWGRCALTDCTISRNVAQVGGGSISLSPLYWKRVVFSENSAATGGGCAVSGSVETYVIGGTFLRNRATDAGAAIAMSNGYDGFLNSVVGCVLISNSTVDGPAAISSTSEIWSSVPSIEACTLVGEWQDTGYLSNSIFWAPLGHPEYLEAHHCVLPPSYLQEGDNISADPQFADLAADDVHLLPTSPGRNAAGPSYGGVDMDGDPRVLEGQMDIGADEFAPDCNGNGQKDWQDIVAGTSSDCDGNALPDDCEPFIDCNGNGVRDACDIQSGTSTDCNGNGLPDECEVLSDCNGNGVLDICESGDCNGNGIPDLCDLLVGSSQDVDGNGVPDECHKILLVPTDKPTLAAAVSAAKSGDTILLEPGVHSGAGNSNVLVAKDLLVAGATDASECILDGLGSARILRATGPYSVKLRGLTLRGGVAEGGGAIAATSQVSLEVVDCNFFGNSGLDAMGGALRVSGGAHAELSNCVFAGNDAGNGGAIGVQEAGSQLLATACSFQDNAATGGVIGPGKGGSLRVASGAAAELRDCIVRGGSAAGGEDIMLQHPGSQLDIAWCDVEGGEAGIAVQTGATLVWGGGNIDADPLFKDAAAQDFRLAGGSPCIDAGDPSGAPDADGTPPDMGALPFAPFEEVGHALAGAGGAPQLAGQGTGSAGDIVTLHLAGAAPGGLATLILGSAPLLAPFKGGVMVPTLDLLLAPVAVQPDGSLEVSGQVPLGLASGSMAWMQFWIVDAGGPAGLAASNGLTIEVR